MPRIRFTFFLSLLLVPLAFGIFPIHVNAAAVPPAVISYQGRLTDSGGNLLGGSGTTYYFKFSIWDSPTVGAGNRVWPTSVPATTTVSVRQGVFNVNIGDTANGYPTPLNVNFSNYSALYIQVEVSSNNNSSETLSPRQQLTSAVYAQVAGSIVGTTTPSLFGTTTPAASSFVTIQATSSTAVPLSILGASGQTANIFQVQNSALQNLFSVSSVGALSLASALTAANGGTGISSYTPGDLMYANSATTLARVASSTGGTILQTSFTTGAPVWVATSSLGFLSSSSLSAVYPLAYNTSTGIFSSAFSTTSQNNFNVHNTFTSLFATNASSTNATTTSFAVTGSATSTFGGGISITRLNTSSTSTLVDILSQSVIPKTDAAYDLGSPTNRFRDLYLSTASLHLESTVAETGAAKQWKFGIDTGNNQQTGTSTGFFRIQEGNSDMFYLNHAGQLGIGVNDPRARLHIQGNPWLSGFSNGTISSSGTTVTGVGTSFLYGYNKLSVGDQILASGQVRTVVSIQSSVSLTVDSAFSPALSGEAYQFQQPIARFDNSMAATKFIIGPGGNVGIGDLNPTGLLSVGAGDAFSINALGTVASGTWNGTKIGVPYGGTGLTNTPTFGQLLLGQANGVYALTSTSTLGLLSSTSLSGGSGIIYNSSTGVITNTISYPFLSNATTTQLAFNGGFTAVGATTTAFAVTGSTTIAGTFNAVGGATLGAAAINSLSLGTALSVANGGTGLSSYTPGDLTYANSATSLARVASSTGGKVLQLDFSTGAPTWVATSSLGISGGGGGGYSLIKDETTGLTARSTLAFLGAGVTCADAGGSQTECTIPGGAGGGVSFASGVADNTTSSNNLIHLTKSGVDVFKVANSGGLSIFAATTDIVKTTTGTTRTQDFSVSGSTLQNVTSSDDMISINSGTITLEGSIAASSPAVTTSAAMGLGGHVILRDDGKYIIIHGNAATGVSIWDGTTTGAMSAAPTILNTAAGAGAISLKRPDGRYLVVKAGGSAGLTALYDPYGVIATAAGPAVCAAGAATTGTNALLRADGKYLIMCGGLAVTSIYDPTLNTVTVGPPLGSGTFGAGAHALQRDDGTFLIFKGGGTGTAIYNPNPGTAGIGTMTDVTITNAPTIAVGAVSIRRQDGQYLVIPGAITTSAIYDPKGTTASPSGTFTAQSGAGNGPSVALGEGAQAFWRQDGNYLLIIGGATVVTTNVVKPGAASGSQFVTTNAPALSAGGAGVGITAFMMPDGKYAILKGNGTAVDYYDMGFVIGGNPTGTGAGSAYWESECIDSTNLNANSVINWTANTEGILVVEERTVTSAAACTTGVYATTTSSGSLINLAAKTDNRIQFRVTFKRDLPKFFDQEWGVRKTSQTRYRRTNKDPALYDIQVANGLALHRTQFDFGDSTATSGPVSINITNNKDKNLGIALEAGIAYGSTISATAGAGGIYNGAFNSNSALTTTAATGTIVMKRPDGKFVVIAGNAATANAQLYDPSLRTFAALGTTPAAGTGAGALALKRPDGKFLLVLGNNTNVTSIFDPVANTFTAGPVLTGLAGDGAQVIPLPNGRVLIVHGNFLNTTSVYDPIQNIIIAGPIPSTVVGPGSIVIPRPDGTFLFIPGTITANCAALNTPTNIFDPYTMVFSTVAATSILGTGPGAFAFQRNDGLWVIVRGGSTITTCAALNATTIYNPVSNRAAVGPVLSGVAHRGAHAIPRPDGTWLVVHGGVAPLTTTSIYRENAGAFTAEAGGPIGVFVAGPALVTAAGVGAISFQKDNGRFVTITGNAGAVVQEYDGGWVDKGIYKTEQFNLGSQLGSDSSLVWRANTFTGISAEVITASTQAGLQTASTREVAKSGALINPGGSDTWLQINFNFNRKFPSYGGIYTDVWGNGGTSRSFPIRKIETPTLYEYKVTKDKDVIDLQSDGLSVFRVSSSGDVYTQAGGSINTSGADLAERYTSQETLDFGEVVSIDPQNNHGVKKALYQYQPDVLGVVSTDPGFVAGAYTKDSYPIALIGRVPVKVSTENGMIHSGDSLTAASVPGHAMKATLAGRVIGKALESLTEDKLEECPASEFVIPGRKCGIIMMFVNLIDYSGQSVDLALSEWKAAKEGGRAALALETGLELPDAEQAMVMAEADSGVTSLNARDAEVLAFLTALKAERAQSASSQSEIFTDKLSAVSQVLSPEIITNILRAQAVEGLEVRSDRVVTKILSTESIIGTGGLSMSLVDGKLIIRRAPATLLAATSTAATSTQLAAVASAFEDASTTLDVSSTAPAFDAATTTPDEIVVSFDTLGNAFFAGEVVAQKVTTGGLSVSGVATFAGGLEVAELGSASTTLSILSDTTFFGRPYFTADTGGVAVIKKGAKYVEIVFEREYIAAPIMSASIVYATTTDDVDIEALLADDVHYAVTKRDAKGFTIRLNKKASVDMSFNWIAIAVKDSKEFTSKTPDPEPVREPAPLVDAPIVPEIVENAATTTPALDVSAAATSTQAQAEPAQTPANLSPELPVAE